jgi:hypothetical protein
MVSSSLCVNSLILDAGSRLAINSYPRRPAPFPPTGRLAPASLLPLDGGCARHHQMKLGWVPTRSHHALFRELVGL